MDLTAYNPIYVRTTGNDSTGNGSLSSPFATAQKAFDTALAGSGNYVLDFGVGSFGGVNLNTAGSDWPVRIAVRGAGATQSFLGGITGNGTDGVFDRDTESNVVSPTAGRSVSIISDRSLHLGNITSIGGGGPSLVWDPGYARAGAGGSVSLIDCTFGNITTEGGSGNQSGGGNGGAVHLTASSSSGYISASGGGHQDGGPGTGGTITITQGCVIGGTISSYGGDGGATWGGSGGNITISDSTCGDVIASGSRGYSDGGGSGGLVSVTDSTCGDITSVGGLSDYSGSGGAGGQVTLTRSFSGVITTTGGASTAGSPGTGGSVTLTDAVVNGSISTNGGDAFTGYSNPGGTGGHVTLIRSICGNITSNGGSGFGISSVGGTVSLDNGSTSANISVLSGGFWSGDFIPPLVPSYGTITLGQLSQHGLLTGFVRRDLGNSTFSRLLMYSATSSPFTGQLPYSTSTIDDGNGGSTLQTTYRYYTNGAFTYFYTNASGNKQWETLTNWNTAPDGSGSNPTEIPWSVANGPTSETDLVDASGGVGIRINSEIVSDAAVCNIPNILVEPGVIRGGTFTGSGFINYGDIYGGTFSGSGFVNGTYIWGGTFTGANGSNSGGTIEGGTFTGVGFTSNGTINGGIFSGSGFTNSVTPSGGYLSAGLFTGNSVSITYSANKMYVAIAGGPAFEYPVASTTAFSIGPLFGLPPFIQI